MSEMRSKSFLFPLLMLAQMLILLQLHSVHHYSFSPELQKQIYRDKFHPCVPHWKKIDGSPLQDEVYVCEINGKEEEHALVYRKFSTDGTVRWVAYGWELETGEFDSKEKAKQAMVEQVVKLIRVDKK